MARPSRRQGLVHQTRLIEIRRCQPDVSPADREIGQLQSVFSQIADRVGISTPADLPEHYWDIQVFLIRLLYLNFSRALRVHEIDEIEYIGVVHRGSSGPDADAAVRDREIVSARVSCDLG